MAMRDPKTGKFLKRVKNMLSEKEPTTLEHLFSEMPEKAEKENNEEFMDMSKVSVDSVVSHDASSLDASVKLNVVPTKTDARQSARRSKTMSATITVIGNLTADPELRTTNNNKSVVNFALAYTPRRPDGSDGNTSFYQITAWEYLADNFAASFKKGDRLVVVGRVSQDKWTDKDSDKVMSRLVITADEIGGTCRFHTVEMTRVKRTAVSESEAEAPADAENADIFA